MTTRYADKKYGGLCSYCGRELAKSGMNRHLSSCAKRPAGTAKVLHLIVEGTYWKDFWLHLIAPPAATLADLDALLRTTWLECCGHLSAFDIGGVRFESHPMPRDWGPKARSMRARVRKALPPGTTFRYQYDYGSTTALQGRSVAFVEDAVPVERLTIIARNLPPPLKCEACEEAYASVIDSWNDAAAFCTACFNEGVEEGEIEEEGARPVVNSPRMGVCGYTG